LLFFLEFLGVLGLVVLLQLLELLFAEDIDGSGSPHKKLEGRDFAVAT